MFSSAKDSIFTLWSLSVGDKQTVPFGDMQSGEPFGSTFSPDGRWVAYASTPGRAGYTAARSPNRGVYIQPFPPSGERYQVPKVERDFHPAWDPKGRELFYVPTASQLAVVSFTTKPTVTFGSPVQLPVRVTGNQLSIDLRAFDVLPDGRFVGLLAPSGADGVGSLTNQIRLVQNWTEELKARVPTK